MDPQPSDPLLGAVIFVLAIASLAVWFALFDRLKRGPILAYESRRPVPWSGYWTILPIGLVVLVVGAVIVSGESKPDDAKALTSVERLAYGSLQQLLLAGVYLAVVVGASKATFADLGLPTSLGQLLSDIRIGAIAWLAALAPVYCTQLALVLIFGQPEGHPLINMLESESSPLLFVAAFLAAVVVAPLCEEVLFRLLLQGWLEKWEDMRLRQAQADPTAPDERTIQAWSETMETSVEPLLLTGPAHSGGVAGLPYGWTPIVLSSLLFALAHFGYGPDPIPLFLLALILGYVYQRTHRIVPSMVAHALFNSMSLFALWRLMSAGAE
jgi:membrane protease YdiL (CAAX protease family)